MSTALAEVALLPGCGGSSLGDDDDDAASPTPTPNVVGGILMVPLTDHPALADEDGFVRFNVAGNRIIIAHVDAGTTYVCLSIILGVLAMLLGMTLGKTLAR